MKYTPQRAERLASAFREELAKRVGDVPAGALLFVAFIAEGFESARQFGREARSARQRGNERGTRQLMRAARSETRQALRDWRYLRCAIRRRDEIS